MFGLGISKIGKATSKLLKRRKRKRRKRKEGGGLLGGRPSKTNKRKKRKAGFFGKKLNKKGKPKKPKKKIAFNGKNDIVRRPHADTFQPGKGRKLTGGKKKKKPGLLKLKRSITYKK